MKASLIMLVSLLVASAAVVLGSFLLPDSYEVRRSLVINAKPEQVFPYLNNPTKWEEWNSWNKDYDPTMIRLYGGPLSGKGAHQEWNGDRVGTVKILFTESTAPSELYYKQQTKGEEFETIGIFSLEPLEDGTRVVWHQKSRVADDLYNRYRGFFKKIKTETEAEQSLLSLKELLDPTDKSESKAQIADRKGRS
ncbi:SRPBCC family protein [Pontibacter sp. BT731]|uniref:SRPBCC family protein n=1 Tax=Pontibacter coccineus TaxID=3063328 RepID=UPI0026E2669E|nr:SRPBCC family protein [Pontibacter sp. BT731]MDO6391387.1 SRPBCC family protein [Pontibacter sp. BT731]